MVGDEDPDPHRLQVPDDTLDVEHRDRVDAGEGFVEKDIPRADHQGPRDLDPPPFAARQGVPLGLPHLGQAEVRDELVDAPLLLGMGKVHGLEDGAQVVLHAHPPEHRGLLRQVADAALGPQVHGQVGDVLAAQEDLPRIRRRQAHDHVEGRSLARAVRAEQADDLPRPDLDGHVLDHRATAVDLPETEGGELLPPRRHPRPLPVPAAGAAGTAGPLSSLPLTSTLPSSTE